VSIRKKLISVVIIINLLIISIYVVYIAGIKKESVYQKIDSTLLAAAAASKPNLMNYHFSTAQKDPSPEQYKKLLLAQGEAASISGVEFIYSAIKKDGRFYFTSDSASEEDFKTGDISEYMSEYEDASPMMDEALSSSQPQYDEFTDEWGAHRSIFLPLGTIGGHQTLIGVDYPMTELKSEIRRAVAGALWRGALLFILSTSAFVVLLNPIISNAQKLISRLENMTKSGLDLTSRLEISSGDEFGRIADKFNLFVETTRSSLSDIMAQVDIISRSGYTLENSVNDISSGISTQALEVEDLRISIDEMNGSISQIAGNSVETSQKASETLNITKNSKSSVQVTIAQIGEIAQSIEQNLQFIERLRSSADAIGSISSVINDIADQTNLLALNAAIEAARAGEHGRGFAVVADEVRKLAEKTQNSTKEIYSTINSLQSEMQGIVENFHETTQKSEKGKEIADIIGVSIDTITEHTTTTADMITQIAAAAEQQSSSTSVISDKVNNINEISHKNSDDLNNISSSAIELNNVVNELKKAVSVFRI